MVKFKNSIKYLVLLDLAISVIYAFTIACLLHKSGHLPYWRSSQLVISATVMALFVLVQSVFAVTVMKVHGVTMCLRTIGTTCMMSVCVASMMFIYWSLETNTEQAVFPGTINFNELISTFGCCDIPNCHKIPKHLETCCQPIAIQQKPYRESCTGSFNDAGQWCPSGCITRSANRPVMNKLGITGTTLILAVLESLMAFAMAISPFYSTQLHTVI
uniref:Tetraspanin n=1 Tax=Panagrellus redivivus TaxID=6233 RepID=A0A7E4VU19_PANRE